MLDSDFESVAPDLESEGLESDGLDSEDFESEDFDSSPLAGVELPDLA